MLALNVLAVAAAVPQMDLNVAKDGMFSVVIDGKQLLTGGGVMAGGHSNWGTGTLKWMGNTSTADGEDELGKFNATRTSYSLEGKEVIATEFRKYTGAPFAVFVQSFPNGVSAPLRDPVGGNTDACRVLVGDASVRRSYMGYTARLNGTAQEGYCHSEGDWAFTGDKTEEECAKECEKLACSCWDFSAIAAATPKAQTIFPGFAITGDSGELPAFYYEGVFPKLKAESLKDYDPGHQSGMPLVIYDPSNASTLTTLVFSPLDEPKAAHGARHTIGSTTYIGGGVKAEVTEIPKGWSQRWLLSAGYGVNQGMMAWGDLVLKVTKKPRADMYRDQAHSTIGFWTDNGGYYHYSTGGKETYEEVLPKVKAYHDSIGVPFGHWQFDSWFYPKDGGVGPGGGGGAVTNWTALESVFPSGMAAIQDHIGLPTIMHNRQWSTKSDYIKNLAFKWYTGPKYAIPEDPEAFFEWFFKQQEGWGLTTYEQDWMCTEYDGVAALQNNISMGNLWLKGMADGAASSGRSVQYCMPYVYDILSAAAYPAVTNARATGDYFHAGDQWAVGGTSLLYWAIGILPFKDGFYSSTNKQTGGQTVGPEKNPDREALMATLSCSFVGPMDGINLLNKTRTMTSCMADGTVLRPDRPQTRVDYAFATGKPTLHLYSAHSDVKGYGRVHYLFSNDDTPLLPEMLYPDTPAEGGWAVLNWYTGDVALFNGSTAVKAGYEGHVYGVVAPVVEGWVLLGETGKYVTHAAKRFLDGSVTTKQLTLQVGGVKGESVEFCAAQATALNSKMCKTVTFSSDKADVSFP